MKKILKQKQLDDALSEKGYVVVPFLAAAQVGTLRSFMAELYPQPPEGFFSSSHHPDLAFRKRASDGILEVIRPAIDSYFECPNPLGGTFIAKSAGGKADLQPHQDWNIVDESSGRSFNIWIPLVDVHESNGAIWVLPGSHRRLATIRGLTFPDAFRVVREQIWDHMELLEMQAGQALIYDHRLLHASKANQSDDLRPAVVFGIVSQETPIRYYTNEEGKVKEYACPDDFYLTFDPASGPGDLPFIRDFPYDFPVVDRGRFEQLFPEFRSEKEGLIARLFRIFKR